MFPFDNFFSTRGAKKNSLRGEIRWIGRVGHGDHASFGQKLLNTQVVWAGVLVNPPSWNGQTHWKSSKKFSEGQHRLSQHHQLVHWTDGFLDTHLVGEACSIRSLPSRRQLQFFWWGGPPSYAFVLWTEESSMSEHCFIPTNLPALEKKMKERGKRNYEIPPGDKTWASYY